MSTLMLIVFGLFGGIIRAIVGMWKHKVFSGKEKFQGRRLLFTIITSALIGAFCALLMVEDYRLVLLAGYAGTDLIQGLYKVVR
jgi:fluoride ion exporter CrcB/FEX